MKTVSWKLETNGVGRYDGLPRKKRVWYPGATYHVMSRGNRRAAIFRDKSDYLEFLECTVAVKKAFDLKIHSLCLMTNHFHMAVETKETELWKAMHSPLGEWAYQSERGHNKQDSGTIGKKACCC